jgi:predicted aspartyl protease
VGPRLVADLVVDGVKVRAVVDTGAADTYLSLTTGKVLDSYASVIQGTGPGGSAPSQVVIRSVDAVTTDGVPLAFDRFIERAGDTGLLGMSAFGRRRIVVDFPHARLRIEDPP